jgi:hypothetical protein
MNGDSQAMARARGADGIGQEARRRAAAAGVVPIGVTWNHGEQLVARPSHVLELFRSNAHATATFSDAELTHFPDRLTKARTDVKLGAMVNDLVRRVSMARFIRSTGVRANRDA